METSGTVIQRTWQRIVVAAIFGAVACAGLKVVLLFSYAVIIKKTDHDYLNYVDRWLGKPNPISRSSTIDLSDGVILFVIPSAGCLTGLLPGAVAGVLGTRFRSRWSAGIAGGAVGLLGVGHAIVMVLLHTNMEFTRGVVVVGFTGLLAGAAAGLVGRSTAIKLEPSPGPKS